jgi:hypothetical protein
MIDQTIPFPELTAGMARCVREWILPHLDDPMARTQAEVLATLLDGLPASYAGSVRDAIGADTDAARTLLNHLGEALPATTDRSSIDDLMRENAAVKARLLEFTDGKRAAGDHDALRMLHRFFVASAENEVRLAAGEGTDFASISVKEDAGKRR